MLAKQQDTLRRKVKNGTTVQQVSSTNGRQVNDIQLREPTTQRPQSVVEPIALVKPLPWKKLEPHTQAWFDQAWKRYSSAQKDIQLVYNTAHANPYICFSCGVDNHLSDYQLNNDVTETFRYCRSCAAGVMEDGRSIIKINSVEDLEEVEDDYNPTTEIPIDEVLQVSKSNKALRPQFSLPTAKRLHWKSMHPVFYIGVTMFLCVVVFGVLFQAPGFIQQKYNDAIYQQSRIVQSDATVNKVTFHLVAQNVAGNITLIIEPEPIDVKSFKSVFIARVLDATMVPSITFDGSSTVYVHTGDIIVAVDLLKITPTS